MTTDEPNVPTHDHSFDDWAHPYVHTGDHPWTSPFGPGHSHGTVTGRLTPNEPKPQDIPYIPPPFTATEPARLSFEDVHFDQDTALELLNDAAVTLRRAIATRDVTDVRKHGWVLDAEAWLARFEELGR